MEKLPQDPIMLLSTVNMLLRDRFYSLDALCDDYEVSRADIETRLRAVGFEYEPSVNQFR